jgi:hypothetical protein
MGMNAAFCSVEPLPRKWRRKVLKKFNPRAPEMV